ncbi:hypothetical protein [Herbiconiux sp. L3-i23]|uniref:hypothetical protein n=1 Tax=Herbiconiux sp. L3-i23 TaxID=2905871 RepID=UPI00205FD8A2|nr:hypothetical protein [Herbiconiux sp. L3-i23]BDI23733.1 hypothetical protein L3i23_25090 [Herbiconiux sp. L3-i23]
MTADNFLQQPVESGSAPEALSFEAAPLSALGQSNVESVFAPALPKVGSSSSRRRRTTFQRSRRASMVFYRVAFAVLAAGLAGLVAYFLTL